MNSSAPVFANVISEITQGHRVSGRTGRPGCYRSPVLRGPENFEKLRFEPRSGLLVFVGALRSGASLSVEIFGNG